MQGLLRDPEQPSWPKNSHQGLVTVASELAGGPASPSEPDLHHPCHFPPGHLRVAQLHAPLAMKSCSFCELSPAFSSKRVGGKGVGGRWGESHISSSSLRRKRLMLISRPGNRASLNLLPFKTISRGLWNSAGRCWLWENSVVPRVGARSKSASRGFSQPDLWEGFTSRAMFSDSNNQPFCIHTSVYLHISQFLESPDPV